MPLRKIFAILIAPLPSIVKVFLLRHILGYRIGSGVKIGLSLINVKRCCIGDKVRIGHFNYIEQVEKLDIGSDSVIGHFNLILGGKSVELGDGAMIGRFNEINSILNPLVKGTPDPRLILGRRAVITAWHKIDFTDKVTIEDSAVLAGRLSNLWTHNRQEVGPVTIGMHCYMGSGIQMVPGTAIGSHCVVGGGAIITHHFEEECYLIAGVPAKLIKPLDEESKALVTFPSRPDLDGAPGF